MSISRPPDFDPILGDARVAPHFNQHEVKGTLLGARARYVREEYGDAALEELKQAVAPEAREYLDKAPLPFAWYPLSLLVEIDRQIALGPMQGDLDKMQIFGDRIARYDLKTIYKVLFKLGTPGFVLKRIGTVYGMYLKGGSAHTEVLGDHEARVSYRNAYYPYYLCKYGMSGWLSASVDLSGGRNIRIEHERCVHSGDAGCAWRISWS